MISRSEAPAVAAAVPAPGWIGPRRGAAFRLVRFLGPSSEPDVRVPSHPALHEHVSVGYVLILGAHGVTSMICPRYRGQVMGTALGSNRVVSPSVGHHPGR